MKKNKLLGLAIAAMISMSSIVPAFAAEPVSQNPTTNTTTIEAKQVNEAQKLAKLTKRAAKLGVDITGLTNEQVREKIRSAVALKLGVGITGLSAGEVKAKVHEAVDAKKLKTTEKITQKATELGIDIKGLSNKDAKTKLKEVREAKRQLVAEKLSEKATKLGVDITGATNKEARDKIKEAREAKKAAKTE